ncbi:MAG: PCMD domain-containing protein, partial [Fibrobacter sp.]|nr:PCMD domain-containing protein [Fibrobacter sp.]
RGGYQLPGSDFNTWKSNDVTPDSIWGNANTILTTTSKYSGDGIIGAKIATGEAVGKTASGSLYTAEFNPKGVGTLAMANSSTWPDGNELLDFGKKFGARPAYMEVTFSYNGSGDSCDVYILLENRTGDKNQNRTASDVNKLVASAWYRSTTGDDEGRENPDVVSVSEANSANMRTVRLKLKYGTPLSGSAIEHSSVFSTTLASKESKAINNGLVQGTGDEPVTHVRVVFASSADGNHYKGKKGATLIVDGMRLIY